MKRAIDDVLDIARERREGQPLTTSSFKHVNSSSALGDFSDNQEFLVMPCQKSTEREYLEPESTILHWEKKISFLNNIKEFKLLMLYEHEKNIPIHI